MPQVPDLLLLDYTRFNQLSLQLARQIEATKARFDLIISISRGGALVSRILSDHLDLSILNLGIRSYSSIEERTGVTFYQPLSVTVSGRRVLLVDEISDTGSTFVAALDYLQQQGVAVVKTACLVVKSKSQLRPDFVVEKTDQWVVFPYEIRETLVAMRGWLEESPELRERLYTHFQSYGVALEVIEGYLT